MRVKIEIRKGIFTAHLLDPSFLPSIPTRRIVPASTTDCAAVKHNRYRTTIRHRSHFSPSPSSLCLKYATISLFSGVYQLERVEGIEPSLEAWEAPVLPLNYTRAEFGRGNFIILGKVQALFTRGTIFLRRENRWNLLLRPGRDAGASQGGGGLGIWVNSSTMQGKQEADAEEAEEQVGPPIAHKGQGKAFVGKACSGDGNIEGRLHD